MGFQDIAKVLHAVSRLGDKKVQLDDFAEKLEMRPGDLYVHLCWLELWRIVRIVEDNKYGLSHLEHSVWFASALHNRAKHGMPAVDDNSTQDADKAWVKVLRAIEKLGLDEGLTNKTQANLAARIETPALALIVGESLKKLYVLFEMTTDHEGKHFKFLGGKRKINETGFIAICRELKEELDTKADEKMILDSNQFIAIRNEPSRSTGALTEYHYHLFNIKKYLKDKFQKNTYFDYNGPRKIKMVWIPLTELKIRIDETPECFSSLFNEKLICNDGITQESLIEHIENTTVLYHMGSSDLERVLWLNPIKVK